MRGSNVASRYASVLINVAKFLCGISRLKKKKAPKRSTSRIFCAIVVDKVLFPDPAKPYTHKTFLALSSAIHSIMSLMTLRLVFLKQGVRLVSSITSGFNTDNVNNETT
jgi:hypothetical protein